MNSKAQGISINLIILAVIGLAVLAIVIAIVTGFFGSGKDNSFGDTISNACLQNGGTCKQRVISSEEGYCGSSELEDIGNGIGKLGCEPASGSFVGEVCCRTKFFG